MKNLIKKRHLLCAVSLSMSLSLAACGSAQNESMQDPSVTEENGTDIIQTDPENTLPDTTQTDAASPDAGSAEDILSTTASEETEADRSAEPIYATIDQTGLEAFYADADAEATPFELSLVSETENPVSEPADWFSQNQLYLPMINGPLSESARQISENPALNYEFWEQRTGNVLFFDDSYVYEWSPEEIRIYDFDSAELLYQVQVASDSWYLMGNCACVRNGVLYACSIYNGYAMPGTCYLVAYDLTSGEILWRSEDQTCNSMNFIVKDGVIFCGYGFTAEPDYIYQISARTGKVLSRTPVKKMPDLFAEKDGQLYVHTYSYDYVFQIED